jgi:hypothetical protein
MDCGDLREREKERDESYMEKRNRDIWKRKRNRYGKMRQKDIASEAKNRYR